MRVLLCLSNVVIRCEIVQYPVCLKMFPWVSLGDMFILILESDMNQNA